MSDVAREVERAFPNLARSESDLDRVMYARDLWPRHHLAVRSGNVAQHKPGAIVWPTSTDEVASLARWAHETKTPLVPFGAGSGVCAGILPREDVVVVDLKRMDRFRRFDTSAPFVEVEAGHMGVPLEEKLNRKGLTLGHFPSSILCSSVGGWVAARSAGQCSGYYGKIEDMVAELEVVLGTGEVVTLRRRVEGPNLIPLIVGSEGILGIVTSATLRLHPLPEERTFGGWSFDTVEQGWEAMRLLFQAGLRPAVSRLYDAFDAMLARDGSVRKKGKAKSKEIHAPGLGHMALRQLLRKPGAINELLHSSFGGKLLGGAMLVLIFEGPHAERDMGEARALCESLGGRSEGEAPGRHWLAHRYSVSYRQAPLIAAGAFVDTMEVAAKWSSLGALYDGVRRALGKYAFVMAHFSHAYADGCCIYFSFAGSAAPDRAAGEGWDAASERTYDRAWKAALAAAVEAGGTLSHHHGVGRSKAPRLGPEAGLGLEIVRRSQSVLDPHRILNPGNLLPKDDGIALGSDAPSGSDLAVDRQSLLAAIPGTMTLGEARDRLVAHGVTLPIGDIDKVAHMSLADWIAKGCPEALDQWDDPADQLLSGADLRLRDGRLLSVRPAPRRAVGPDLLSLVVGCEGRIASVERAWVRVHRHGTRRPLSSPFAWDRRPAVTEGESGLLERLAKAITDT